MDWKRYSDALKDFFENEENGILLDADHIYGTNEDSGGWAFELTSKTLRKKFLAVWELFDHSKEFQECMKMLAFKATQICDQDKVTLIVTATSSVKEIANQVRPLLDPQNPVTMRHMGDLPSANIMADGATMLSADRVLILTDVIATGKMISSLSQMVERQGASVVSVLAIALTGKDRADDFNRRGYSSLSVGGRTVPVHSLTALYIPDVSEIDRANIAPDHIRKIDSVTVLPEMKPAEDRVRVKPIFDLAKAVEHFQKADAIDFGYYTYERKRFTIKFHLDRLLTSCRKDISEAVISQIDPEALLVTTSQLEDMRFANMIVEELKELERPHKLQVLKRTTKDTPEFHFALFPKSQNILSFGNIVLLLATLATAEELKNIAALLASLSAQKITVICLVSRMGFFTTGFISRIDLLTKGLAHHSEVTTPENEPSPSGRMQANFSFRPVYHVLDADMSQLSRTSECIEKSLRSFEGTSRVTAYQKLTRFFSESYRGTDISNPSYDKQTLYLEENFKINVGHGNPEISAFTEQAKIFSLTQNLILNHDIQALLSELKVSVDPTVVFHLVGLLLTESEYLRSSSELSRIGEYLLNKIFATRQQRLTREASPMGSDMDELGSELQDGVQLEVSCIASLALLEYFGLHQELDQRLVLRMIYQFEDLNQWRSFPANFQYQFSSIEFFWAVSLFLHSANRHVFFSEALDSLRDSIVKSIREIRAIKFGEGDTRSTKLIDRSNREGLKKNLDYFLQELGAIPVSEKHQIINYLHYRVLRKRVHHFNALAELDNCMNGLTSLSKANTLTADIVSPKKQLATDGITAVAELTEIAHKIRQFYIFTPSESRQRYVAEKYHDGFACDLHRLDHLLTRARSDGPINLEDLKSMADLIASVAGDLSAKESPFLRDLLGYVVQVYPHLHHALKTQNSALERAGAQEKKKWTDIWLEEIRKTEAKSRLYSGYYLLIDKSLFKEVLANMFYNVHHAWKTKQSRSARDVKLLIRKLDPSQTREVDLPEMIQFLVESYGEPVDLSQLTEDKTFVSDQAKIAEFGGSLTLKPLASGKGSITELKLISRGFFALQTEAKTK